MIKPVNAVQLHKISDDRLNDIVGQRQLATHNRVTKIAVIADLIEKAHKKEIK